MTERNKFLLALIFFTLTFGCVVVHEGPPGHVKHVGPPPPVVVFEAEPRLVLIPSMTIYYAPDVEEDIYVVGGIWYLRVEGVWYSSRSYNGPWVFVERGHVPPGLAKIPPGHLKGKGRPGGAPPGQLKKGNGAGEGGPPGQMKKVKGKGKGKWD